MSKNKYLSGKQMSTDIPVDVKGILQSERFKTYMDEWNALTPEQKKLEDERIKEDRKRDIKMYIDKIEIQNQYKSQTSLSLDDAERYTWATFEPKSSATEESARLVKAWCPGKFDVGLFLYGNCGVGKTHMMKAIIQQHHSETHTFRYVSAYDLVNHLKHFDQQEQILAFYGEKYALMIDDIGVLSGTDFENQVLWRIFEGRKDRGRVTFIGCDISKEEIDKKFTKRVLDRFMEFTIPVNIKGETNRKTIMKNNLDKLRAEAGLIDRGQLIQMAKQDTIQLIKNHDMGH